MTPPLVSIGIPTYNRPHYLRESLASALAQTYPRVEVVVSDNASATDPEPVVREVGGGRVIYRRNPTNLGSTPNFLKALEPATGEYFVWLQDDDLLVHDFVARGVAALEREPAAAAYLGFAQYAHSPGFGYYTSLFGPPVRLDWLGGRYRVLPGALVAALSLFTSMASPPNVVFRTDRLRQHQHLWVDPRLPHLVERTLLSAVARDRAVVAAPHVGAIFRIHGDQYHREIFNTSKTLPAGERAMAEILGGLAGPAGAYADELTEALNLVPPQLFALWHQNSRTWPAEVPLCRDVRAVVERVAVGRGVVPASPVARYIRRQKNWVRRLVPPVVYDGAGRVAQRFRRQQF